MGHSDSGWVRGQFEIPPAPQLLELPGVVSLGIQDEDKTSRTAAEGLTLCESDLVPQALSLEEWQWPPPDTHRLGLTAQAMDENRHDTAGWGFRLIYHPATVSPALADDFDNAPGFNHRRTALPR
jgi:hypothetical protein